MLIEHPQQRLPIIETHREAKPSAIDSVHGQFMRLLVAYRLDEIFQPAQVSIRVGQ